MRHASVAAANSVGEGQGATATWEELVSRWEVAPEWPRFRDILRVKTKQIPSILLEVSPLVERTIEALPDYYVSKIRPAAPYLFREWMPVGYSCMLAIDDTDVLRDATVAALRYGAAVTVLDDVADTDAFDQVLGPGSSDAIADAAHAYAFSGDFTFPRSVPEQIRPVVEFVAENTNELLDHLGRYDEYRPFDEQFRTLLRALFKGVVECRRVRRSMEAHQAGPNDLAVLRAAAPHGMTVALIGLIGFAHCGGTIDGGKEALLADLLFTQVACHYANGLATLDRELAYHDPSNPIVLHAIEQGMIDGSDYVRGRLSEELLRPKLAASREHIVAHLRTMTCKLDERRPIYHQGGAGPYLENFLFGLRSLSTLYDLASGRV